MSVFGGGNGGRGRKTGEEEDMKRNGRKERWKTERGRDIGRGRGQREGEEIVEEGGEKGKLKGSRNGRKRNK